MVDSAPAIRVPIVRAGRDPARADLVASGSGYLLRIAAWTRSAAEARPTGGCDTDQQDPTGSKRIAGFSLSLLDLVRPCRKQFSDKTRTRYSGRAERPRSGSAPVVAILDGRALDSDGSTCASGRPPAGITDSRAPSAHPDGRSADPVLAGELAVEVHVPSRAAYKLGSFPREARGNG